MGSYSSSADLGDVQVFNADQGSSFSGCFTSTGHYWKNFSIGSQAPQD